MEWVLANTTTLSLVSRFQLPSMTFTSALYNKFNHPMDIEGEIMMTHSVIPNNLPPSKLCQWCLLPLTQLLSHLQTPCDCSHSRVSQSHSCSHCSHDIGYTRAHASTIVFSYDVNHPYGACTFKGASPPTKNFNSKWSWCPGSHVHTIQVMSPVLEAPPIYDPSWLCWKEVKKNIKNWMTLSNPMLLSW